jgi:Ca-activated chloride channel family protein
VRPALLAGLLVLALAAPAGAQAPIAGGGSFNDAPVLGPGRYEDTLRGGEQLFYAVEVKAGQQLRAGATVTGRTDTSYIMKLALYSPLREKDNFEGEQSEPFGQADRSVSLRVEGQPVGEAGGGVAEQVYSEPGTFYISLAADEAGANPVAEQFETRLDLQVTGEPIPDPTPTATPEPAETAAPDDTAGLGSSGGDGGSAELGIAIVFGLALGGLVGFGVRRLRAA